MIRKYFAVLFIILFYQPHPAFAQDEVGTIHFNVELRCEGLSGQTLEFKMPAWTPDYPSLILIR